MRDAAQNYINAMSDLGEWLGNKVGNTIWEGDMDVEINTFDNLLPEVPQPNSVPGQMTRGVTQFLTGFVPAMRAVKYKQAVSTSEKAFKAMAASGISDFFVFDPHAERLSNLIEEVPELKNPITEYLKADPNDSAVEGRLKNVLEGFGLDAFTAGAFVSATSIVRNVKGRFNGKQETLQQFISPKPVKDIAPQPLYGSHAAKSKSSPLEPITDEGLVEFDSITVKSGDKALNINPAKITSDESLQNILIRTAK